MDQFVSWHKSATKATISKLLRDRPLVYYTYLNTKIVVQDIFTLFDSPAFILALEDIRKKAGISMVPIENFRKLTQRAKISKKIPHPTSPSQKEFAKLMSSWIHWQNVANSLDKTYDKLMYKLILATGYKLREIKKPPYLIEIAMQAALFGVASWNYRTHREIFSDSFVSLPIPVIVLHPRITYKELKDIFKRVRTYYVGKTEYRLLPKYMPNFMDYSDWYWERIGGKSYSQIAKEWNDQTEQSNISENDVSRAVNKYAKLLSF